ncbi:hypothetical protein H5T89_03740 [bacterium]|nr:hypothetical protein [bacterium]
MLKVAHTTSVVVLILILFINSAYANSDIKRLFTAIPWDKQLHFTWGFVLTATITALTGSLLVGISVAILLEVIKEYLIDDFPDREDIIYTVTGVLFGYLISDMLVDLGKAETSNNLY